MPHCHDPQPKECATSLNEDIKDHDESSHPSCTLLFLGSTVVAYSIYHTAEWLLREQQEWFRRRRHEPPPPSSLSPDSEAKPLSREKVSRGLSCLKKCVEWVHLHRRRRTAPAQGVQAHARPSPQQQELGQPPQKIQVPFYRRLAQCGCCCCFSLGERDEEQEENELHDPMREAAVDNEGCQEGEVTIIHFEQREADAQRTITAEEPQEPTRRRRKKSSVQLARERLQKARANKQWEEAVDFTFRRVVYSIAGGTIIALTMFSGITTRWSVIALGAGLGLGSALRDSSYILAG